MKDIYIQTQNLIIREISIADVFSLERIRQAINANKNNRPYYALKDPGDAQKFCKEALQQQDVKPRETVGLAITEKKKPHQMIGFVIGELTDLDKKDWDGQVGLGDIGYFMDPHFQGKGFVTEAIRGFMSKLFFEELGYPYLSATVHPQNTPSINVLQSVGFIPYGSTLKYGGEPRLLLRVDKDDFYAHKNHKGENKNIIVSQNTKIVKGFLQEKSAHERG